MTLINWAGFTWEAFATLVTGLAAVGAATYVGRKQAAIFDRQVRLAELTLRSKLFEKRFAVYQATVRLLSESIQGRKSVSKKAEQDFLRALERSWFLFRPKVYGHLREIWKDYQKFCEAADAMVDDKSQEYIKINR